MHKDILAKVLNFRNDEGKQIWVKAMFTSRTAPVKKKLSGSSRDSQFSWGQLFFVKFLQDAE